MKQTKCDQCGFVGDDIVAPLTFAPRWLHLTFAADPLTIQYQGSFPRQTAFDFHSEHCLSKWLKERRKALDDAT